MFLALSEGMEPGDFGVLFALLEVILILVSMLTAIAFIGAIVFPIVNVYYSRFDDWIKEKEKQRKEKKYGNN